MGYPELLAKARELTDAVEIIGAIGAEMRLRQLSHKGDPQVREALNTVLGNLEPGLLDALEPGQVAAIIGRMTFALQDALDLIKDPEKAPGWRHTDPTILQERGRGSRSLAQNFANLARQRPELDAILTDCDFLDIGIGVGWLAIEVASLWPGIRIVGLDIWEPALQLAETNIAAEGLQDRITLRRQSISDIEDEAAFDLIWLPSPFLPRDLVISALPCVVRALRPGGFLLFGMFSSHNTSALSKSLVNFQTIRSGGYIWEAEEVTDRLCAAGLNDIEVTGGDGGKSYVVIARRS